MPNPEFRQIHVNSPLTQISTAYIQSQRNFIADQVFPIVPVAKQGDLYYAYNKGDWFRSTAGVRAPATESVGGGWEVKTEPYFAPVYAVHKDVDDQTAANAGPTFNLERDATDWVTNNLLIKRDRIFVDSYLKTGIWGTDLAGVGATPGAGQFLRWDVSGSTPIEDVTNNVLTIARGTGFRPNTLLLGAKVFNVLSNHSTILDRIKYTERGIVTEELLAALFGVDRVLVTWGTENTAPKGAADTMVFQNEKTALLAYAAPSPGLLQPSAGYTFAWTGLLGASAFGNRIKRFRMEPLEAWRIEGEMAFDMRVIGSDLGVFFDAAVA